MGRTKDLINYDYLAQHTQSIHLHWMEQEFYESQKNSYEKNKETHHTEDAEAHQSLQNHKQIEDEYNRYTFSDHQPLYSIGSRTDRMGLIQERDQNSCSDNT